MCAPTRRHSPHTIMENPMNRRCFLAATLALAPAALLPRAALPAAAQSGTLRTTTDLNLRLGPGLDYQVLLVIPEGALVIDHNEVINGYRFVTYNGTRGWAFDAFLAASEPAPPPGEEPYDPSYATTTADVNLRAEPSLSGAVLAVIPAGTRVRLNPEFANGFRGVEYLGVNGWVRVDYLN